jgi:hypothetical protein
LGVSKIQLREAVADGQLQLMADSDGLTDAIERLLRREPGLCARDITFKLNATGWAETRQSIIRALCSDGRFRDDHSGQPPTWHTLWTKDSGASSGSASLRGSEPSRPLARAPRAWQIEAFAKWKEFNQRGVIEA